MWPLLKLTRPINLLIIATTMVLMRIGVIEGDLERAVERLRHLSVPPVPREDIVLPDGFGAQMPVFLFVLLVISTVLIAAGGNIINDYFDTRIDRINKPGEVIVGRKVKRRVAMGAHMVLSAAGALIGMFVAWRSGMLHLAIIPLFAVAALWWYSTRLKRRLITGNLTVALLTALVPLTVGLYEIPLLERNFALRDVAVLPDGSMYEIIPAFHKLWGWILGFSFFAFLSTLVRELQKDMADVKGDLAGGCRTVPIVWGMPTARTLALVHIAVLLLGTIAVRMVLPDHRITYYYLGIGVLGPLLLSAGFTYKAVHRSEFVRAGMMMKLAMVMAIGFALLIHLLP